MADSMNPLPSPLRSFAWRSIVVVFGLSLVIVIVIGTISYLYAQSSLKTISAGDIVFTPVTPSAANSPAKAQIKGSFTIATVPPGQENADAIPSYGTGGACLVAEWEKFGLQQPAGGCSTNQQCREKIPVDKRGSTDKPDGWYGYCDTDGKDGDDGKCWLKPGGKKLCDRSIDHGMAPWGNGPHEIPMNPYYVPAAPGSTPTASSHTIRESIDWRVVACLNGIKPNGDDSRDCGEGGGSLKKQVFGKTKKVPHGLIY